MKGNLWKFSEVENDIKITITMMITRKALIKIFFFSVSGDNFHPEVIRTFMFNKFIVVCHVSKFVDESAAIVMEEIHARMKRNSFECLTAFFLLRWEKNSTSRWNIFSYALTYEARSHNWFSRVFFRGWKQKKTETKFSKILMLVCREKLVFCIQNNEK